MKIVGEENGSFLVQLGRAELVAIEQCIAEVCYTIDIPATDYNIRIGVSKSDLEEMLEAIKGFITGR